MNVYLHESNIKMYLTEKIQRVDTSLAQTCFYLRQKETTVSIKTVKLQ